MKVLMFGWEFPPHVAGGLATACYGLTKGLAKHNVDMIFVVPKAYGDEDGRNVRVLGAEDVTLEGSVSEVAALWKHMVYFEAHSHLLPYLAPEEFESITSAMTRDGTITHTSHFARRFKFAGGYGKNLLNEVTQYALLAHTIARQNEFDVIHAHDWLTYLAGIAAKKASGKPLVIHVHATEFDRSGENVNQMVYDIERRGMAEADMVITVSNLTRNIVVSRYGIDPAKVQTVHNAVDFNTSSFDDVQRGTDEKIVTFLGRITYQKGPDYFVEAANKVLKRYSNVRFVMAGSGDMLHRMIRHVAKLGIADKFNFTGFLRGDDVPHLFALSDVYVMPSVSEPFGISPLEAMRTHVPTIISKQSGVAEVLRHTIKVDFWDVDAMADAIYGILQYPALTKMFIRLGDREVESLKWDNAALKVKQAYEKVTAKNGKIIAKS
ncbi:MAG: glycosyltransferase family 4 protein [Prevotellaceae bacterium]|jgi:glycosyltransferase involved in cell wall biosynthesis|nr:glycosyltransferase family 4 protein [Prevotellaceae bacterium]